MTRPDDTFPHRLSVAPMMERTDRHCRYLLRQVAPRAWLYTEMITARAILHGQREALLRFDPAEHPVALQVGGAEPGELAAAARLGADAGYDEINLNVGCPSGRVQAGRFGVALMLDAPLVARCVGAMREAVDVPVTVKTRIGVDEHDSDAFLAGFVREIAAAGCRTVVVHARKAWLSGLSPKENREIPELDYLRVHRLKAEFPDIEIVINGGFVEAGAAEAQLAHVDGVMLGRAAYRDPMLLAAVEARLFSGGGRAERGAVVAAYLAHLERELAAGTPLKAMTRHLLGLYTGERGGRRWRRELGALPGGREGLEALERLMRRFGLDANRA